MYRKKHVLVLYNDDGLMAVVPYMNQYTAGNIHEELQRFVEPAKCQPDSEALLAYIQKEITLCRD